MNLRHFATNLFLHEVVHLFFALISFAIINYFFRDWFLSAIAFFVSLAVDIDHYLEALFVYRFNLLEIIKNKYNCWLESGKMTIFLHSWEVVIVLMIGTVRFSSPLLFSLALPLALHCLIDTLIYSFSFKMPIYQYFLCYRAFYGFDFVVLYNQGKPVKMTKKEIRKKYGR